MFSGRIPTLMPPIITEISPKEKTAPKWIPSLLLLVQNTILVTIYAYNEGTWKKLKLYYVDCLRSLSAVLNVELYLLALIERLETVSSES